MQRTCQVIEIGWRPVEGGLPFACYDGHRFNVWPELDPAWELAAELAATVSPADIEKWWEDTAEAIEQEEREAALEADPPSEVHATLHYDIETAEGEERLLDALNGSKYRWALQGLDNWLRNRIKYAGDSVSDVQIAERECCREQIHAELEERGLRLWE